MTRTVDMAINSTAWPYQSFAGVAAPSSPTPPAQKDVATFDPGRPVWVVRLDRPDGTHNSRICLVVPFCRRGSEPPWIRR